MQELRLEVSIPLPEGTFEEAAALVKLRPILEQFRAALQEASAPDSIAWSCEPVTPRPRAPKADAAPKMPRAVA